MYLRYYCVFITLSFNIDLIQAQSIFPPDSVKKKIKANAISNNLMIDGNMDEEEWKIASTTDNFIQSDPFQGKNAKRRIVVKLLYNEKFLYVAVICYDTVGISKYRLIN